MAGGRNRSLDKHRGTVVVASLTFALDYSSGPVAAAGIAVATGVVIGGAYYLGRRVFSESSAELLGENHSQVADVRNYCADDHQ